jgi:uncharacterized membrane protein
VLEADHAQLAPEAEAAQPLYARYWLHNRGPAQMGFLPVSLSVSPTVARTAGAQFEISMVIANQYADAAAEGTLTLDLPAGWTSDADRPVTLEPGGYARYLAYVTPAENTEPGQYFVAARVVTKTDALAGGSGVQAVEDVVTVFVGDSPELTATIGFGMPPTEAPDHGSGAVEGEPGRPTGLTVTPSTQDLRLSPGDKETLELTFENNTSSEIRAELQLASPYGTWSWLPEPVRAVVVPPKSSVVVPVPVQAPADASPAHAWVLPKVMWFGRAQYAPTVRLEIS